LSSAVSNLSENHTVFSCARFRNPNKMIPNRRAPFPYAFNGFHMSSTRHGQSPRGSGHPGKRSPKAGQSLGRDGDQTGTAPPITLLYKPCSFSLLGFPTSSSCKVWLPRWVPVGSRICNRLRRLSQGK